MFADFFSFDGEFRNLVLVVVSNKTSCIQSALKLRLGRHGCSDNLKILDSKVDHLAFTIRTFCSGNSESLELQKSALAEVPGLEETVQWLAQNSLDHKLAITQDQSTSLSEPCAAADK